MRRQYRDGQGVCLCMFRWPPGPILGKKKKIQGLFVPVCPFLQEHNSQYCFYYYFNICILQPSLLCVLCLHKGQA